MVGASDVIGNVGTKLSIGQFIGNQISGAARNASWILVILGAIHYFLRLRNASSGLIFIFSFTLLLFGLYAISSRLSKDRFAVIIPVLLFFIWYVIFQSRIDSSFLMYYLPTVALLLISPILITRGQSIAAEGAGFLVVLVFFLDVGFMSWITGSSPNGLGLEPTNLIINLILFMPWWSYLGLFTLPPESTSSDGVNALIQITKVIGILYIILVIVAPSIPDMGYISSSIPSIDKFEKSQTEFRQKYTEKQNPFLTNLQCVWEGRYKDVPGCVREKQEEKRLAYICEFQEKVSPKDKLNFKKCIQEQKKKKKNTFEVAGSIDQTIKFPTNVYFKDNEYFPKLTTQRKDDNLKINYPLEFHVENPREQVIKINLGCEFKTKDGVKETIMGEIKGNKLINSKEKKLVKTILCPPTKKLRGKYDLIYSAELINLETNSVLRRAFIGKKDNTWKEEWFPKLKSTYFPGNSYLSRAPSDLARLNFAFGSSVNNPIISDENFLILSSSIENLGRGEISNINSYHINLDGFSVDDGSCFGKSDYGSLKKKIKGTETLGTCLINSLPSELEQPLDFVIKEFSGSLNYDYKITKKIPVEVKVINMT
jgi:hypothetical protein